MCNENFQSVILSISSTPRFLDTHTGDLHCLEVIYMISAKEELVLSDMLGRHLLRR